MEEITRAFPGYKFRVGRPRWTAKTRTIYYEAKGETAALRLLHEIVHAELGHREWLLVIERLQMERDAWEHVRSTLAPRFMVEFDEEQMENDLDSYREWLHTKSLCAECGQNRWQDDEGWHCPFCRT
jgi:hypothetical protein